MKRLLALFALGMFCVSAFAQALGNYSFATTAETYSPISGGTLLGNESTLDQRFLDPSVPLGSTSTGGPGFPLGFNFYFGGQEFDRVGICADGWLSLGQSWQTTPVMMNSSSYIAPLSTTTGINPAWQVSRVAGLALNLAAQTGSSLRIETVGTQPYRVFVAQWTNFKKSSNGTADSFSFQIRLEETTNKVQIVYGTITCNATSTAAQVGMRAAPSSTASNYANRTTTTDWAATSAGSAANSTCTLSSSVYPVSGTSITWTPPAPLNSVYTIGSGGDFGNFADAFNFLNASYPSQGLPEGGTVFNVSAGQTFVQTELLPALTATGSPNRTITFQKSGTGSNPVLQVQGTTATTDAAIRINGGDWYVFESLDIQNYATLTSLEYGIFLSAQSYDPCTDNLVSGCGISLSRSNTNTRAINSLGTTGAGNRNNLYDGLVISSSNAGIYLMGNSSLDNHNYGEQVSDCVLSDVSSLGIYLDYSVAFRITLNQISMCAGNTVEFSGIKVERSTSTGEVDGNTIIGNTSSSGISGLYASHGTVSWHGNTIRDFATTGTITRYGIYIYNGYHEVYDNHVHSFNSLGNLFGIFISINADEVTIYSNEIHNLKYTGPTGSGYTSTGISASGTDITVANNLIYDLSSTGDVAPMIRGIATGTGTSVKIYYNTVFLKGGGTNTNFGSAALYLSSVGLNLDVRNNIFVDLSTPGTATTGRAAAIWKGYSGFSNFSASSDRNIYYAGAPGDKNLICYDNGISYQTLTDYKNATQTFDLGSFTEYPPFISTSDPMDIHLISGAQTVAESNALPIPGWDTDFDSDPRDASFPDVGADEGSFTVPAVVPQPATLISPADLAIVVTPSSTLNWAPSVSGGTPTGYLLYFGTNDPPTNIANGIDLGNVTTYDPDPDLALLTTYYWKIVPYNATGSAEPSTCPVWSFETHAAPLTGTYVIGSTGYYPSFSLAITHLNAAGVGTGGVEFQALAGEVFAENPPSIIINASAENPVLFTSSNPLGQNPLITPTGGTNTFGIRFSGSDYVTFDHIDIANVSGAGNLNYGYWILNSSSDPANNITIQNCSITLDRNVTGTISIYISGSGAGGGNRVLNNILQSAKNGVYHYPDTAQSGPEISGNILTEISYGIYCRNSTGGTISQNAITFPSGTTDAFTGIYAYSMNSGEIHHNNISGGSTTATCQGMGQRSGSVLWHHNSVSGIHSNNVMEGFECYSGTITLHDNEIHNLSSNNSIYGIEANLDANGTTMLYNNRIHDLVTNSTGAYYSIGILMGISTSSTAYNNMIWDLRNPGGTTAPQVSGFQVSNSTANLYFNTVYLDASGTNNSFSSACLYVSGGTSTRFNNNIFLNLSTPGNSGISAGLWKSADGFANINTLSDNNIWYAGTPGPRNMICRTPAVYYETLDDFKAAAVSFDQNSFTESVPLAGLSAPAYDLHIEAGAATIAESNGIPISGIDTDIDADPRNALTPDIGADEGDFLVPATVPAPAVIVSPQMDEYAVSINPTLVWYASGAGGAPTGYRVYMGSDNPPANIVNGLDIGNVLSFECPVTLGYLSTYYWKIVPYNDNGSTDPGTCPVWQFSTHQVPLTGNWVIGSGGFYPDFTHAIKYLNASGVGSGGVTFKAVATEVFAENPPPITVSGTAVNPIVFTSTDTLAVNPKITATGGTGTYGIKLEGADYVTIDHIDISNLSGQSNLVYGIWLEAQTANGCTDNTIQSCNITLDRSTDGAGIRNDSSSGMINHRNRFLRNTVTNARSGIYVYDSSAAQGLVISGNQMSNLSSYGIYTRYTNSAVISYNQISMAASNNLAFTGISCYNESGTGLIHHNTISGGSTTGNFHGIYNYYDKYQIYSNMISGITSSSYMYGIRNYYGGGSADIYENTISGLSSTGSSDVIGISVTTVDIYQNTIWGLNSNGIVRGINLNGGTASRNKIFDLQSGGTSSNVIGIYSTSTVTLHNNMIYDLWAPSSNSVPQIRGINVNSTVANLYFNSVLLTSSGTASHSSAALFINDPTTVNIQNNIFSNLSTPGAEGKAVAFWNNQPDFDAVASASNNNIWYAGIPSTQHLICYYGTNSCQSLEAYKAANIAKDQNSLTEDAPFLSKVAPFNLHLDPAQETYAESNALVVTGIGTDFDGETRDAARPDIGADEGSFTEVQLPPALPVYLSPLNGAVDLALNTPISWAAGSGGGNPDYYIVYFGQTNPPPQVATNYTGTSYQPGLLPEHTYYWKVDAVNNLGTAAGVEVWSFDTRADDTIMEYPFTESFEEGNTAGSTSIYRWTQALGSGSYYWTANSSTNYNRSPRTGSLNLTLRDGGDAWLFRPVYLSAGQSYELELWARQFTSSGAQAYLQVRYGNSPSVAGMTQTIINIQEFVSGDYQRAAGTFTAPSTGIWYLGIHGVCTNYINFLSLDDVSINFYEPYPSFSINPESWNFGMVNVSQTTDPKAFVISNPGDADLVIQSGDVYLEGSHSDDFILTDPAGEIVIAAGETYTLYVSFAPLETGLRSASLVIIDNTETRATHQIPLTGRGIGPLVPPCLEDFEDGWLDWITVNGSQTNKWELGTASPYRNSYSAYISTNYGATNSYNPNSNSVTHFYHDVSFPSDMTGMLLKFQYKCAGESGFDYLSVHITDTSFVPVAGSSFSQGQIGVAYHSQADWQLAEIALDPALAGQTKRLIFSWRNDGGGGTQPPAAIDNLRIYSTWPYLDVASAPQNLQIDASGANVTLTWDKITGANDYIIEDADMYDGVFSPIGRGFNSFSIPGSHPRRFFRVRGTE